MTVIASFTIHLYFVEIEPGSSNMRTRAVEKVGGVLTRPQDPTGIDATGLIGTAPRYLAADCVPVSEMAQRRHLRSAAGHQLAAPSHGLRAFSVYSVRNCGILSA